MFTIKALQFIRVRFFGNHMEFRVRLFNVLAMAGAIISLIVAVVGIFINAGLVNIIASFISMCASFALLFFSARTGRYQLCYMVSIVFIFLILFPVLFFSAGGYHSGMPSFFIFAVLFTVFMIEGKMAFVLSAVELAEYVAICLIAKAYPQTVNAFATDTEVLTDILAAFLTVSLSLSVCMFIHFRIYNQQQRELEAARQEALRHSEVKNIFLANMSHEIRTPINIMLGMTDMVLRESRDETVNAYARKIQNAGDMLLVLVSNILDFSRIEKGKLEIHEHRYRTANLIKELYDFGMESAGKRGLAFSMQADGALPAELMGDMPRIKQIVLNFLSNAAKYTDEGSITLSIGRKTGGTGGRILLCASVADTGIGIKRENQAVIFDAFSRLDLHGHPIVEGTGLGLAIAKQLAEGMGGDIFVRSAYGAGSTFGIEIPQRVADPRPMGDWRHAAGEEHSVPDKTFVAPDARILVVDDNRENLETIHALLRRTLMHVDLVDSGADCLAAARDAQYHIILMDYMMPDMDGVETLRQLRRIPGFDARVIALTSNAIAGTREKMLAAGFSAYIAKPVMASELEEALASMLAHTSALVTTRTVYPHVWVTSELKHVLERDLAVRGVSLEEGLKNAGGDLPLLGRMADVFVRNYPGSLALMRDAAGPYERASDEPSGATDLRRLAHSLKSAAGYVGASSLSFYAQSVEQGCRDGDNQKVRLTLPLMFMEWERVVPALSAFAAHVQAVEPNTAAV